jgi:hypothetical protein
LPSAVEPLAEAAGSEQPQIEFAAKVCCISSKSAAKIRVMVASSLFLSGHHG